MLTNLSTIRNPIIVMNCARIWNVKNGFKFHYHFLLVYIYFLKIVNYLITLKQIKKIVLLTLFTTKELKYQLALLFISAQVSDFLLKILSCFLKIWSFFSWSWLFLKIFIFFPKILTFFQDLRFFLKILSFLSRL